MKKSAFVPADILIPATAAMNDWSVIACDQFTSEREYWDRVSERTAGKLSTFHMVLPEAYLNDVPLKDMAAATNSVMDSYLAADAFETVKNSFIYVERSVSGGVRHGLVGAIDLDMYDYSAGSKAPVRASEKTVIERLPARVTIREGASLELPHVMVLIDDAKKSVIEPLRKKTGSMRKLYDFELMEDGGHIKGYQVEGKLLRSVESALESLAEREVQMVIGDGNHSLAAAKELWERLKKTLSPDELKDHPARYALVELNNVYDEGVRFEPIHRVVFNVCPKKLTDVIKEKLGSADGRSIVCVSDGKREEIKIRGRSFGKMIELLEDVLEEYAALCGGVIDYIHDEEAVTRLTAGEGSIGILLPAMDKADLFCTVISDGVFPKKSFSIGHARDKRYYLECRKIK